MTDYASAGKRGFDLLLVLASLPLTLPLAAAGWVIARVSTGDRGLFSHERIGRDGRLFRIWKLQTMRPVSMAEDVTHRVGVTTVNNSRITPAGAWLRRTKLDEVPQLWNVLKGDMSLVGPRPDVPAWLDVMAEFDSVLRLRPGITSLASLVYVDEESMLACEVDPIAAYGTRLLPHKLRLNELYAGHLSWWLDVRVILLTLVAIVRRRWAVSIASNIVKSFEPPVAIPMFNS